MREVSTITTQKHYATETNIKEQIVNSERSEATQEAGIMMDVSQTQLEADTSRVELLKPKTKKRVGCWKVRTLNQHRGGVAIIMNRKVENSCLTGNQSATN